MNLFQYQDNNYKDFQSKLLVSKYRIIGVRLPVLRKIAMNLNLKDFNDSLLFDYYEEVLLYGMIICKIKDINKRWERILEYLKIIDCWSICDYLCTSASFVKEDKDYYFARLLNLLHSKKEFYVRFSLVMFLKYYKTEEYVDEILREIMKIKLNTYYEKMATAWMLCEYYYLYPIKIKSIINKFNKEVIKMFESKVRDSKKKIKINS